MSKKQKKNKKFEIKASDAHPSVVKVPKKKKGKKMYFDLDVQDAIVRYNDLDPDKDQVKRNKIYAEEIHYAFDKLCENIINTFKFEYFDDVYIDVKHEVVAFLIMNIHKYDHTKGSKAFSYFSVVCKNYLILHNNANYKKYKSHTSIDALNKVSVRSTNWMDDFFEELIEYFEKNIPSFFRKKRDADIAYAILELLEKRRDIENFNKKSLYILIREMTGVETVHITHVANIMKKHYKTALREFEVRGTLTNNKKFF